ncbi:hypothetical protein ACIP6Q_39225 [Streptomyces bobili]|uniref:hypothetical protein n=1 Tax=Streptomyces bobili TaxID=67280 RepID=UPI0038223D1F
MNEWTIALGALILVLAITAGALLSRWYFAPMADGPTDVGWCPAERRERLHAYSRYGRRCWTCRTFTPAGGTR